MTEAKPDESARETDLTPEEARVVIETIAEVEKEEAAELDDDNTPERFMIFARAFQLTQRATA